MIARNWRPDLLDETGVGPIVAAVLLCAWSHAGRCRSEGASAMLGGSAPVPASSGMTVRHRLNRSGDRQLNRALHTIVLVRLRYDSAAKAYSERRTQEGRTPAEIKRCLKHYVSRQIYRSWSTANHDLTVHCSVPRIVDLAPKERTQLVRIRRRWLCWNVASQRRALRPVDRLTVRLSD